MTAFHRHCSIIWIKVSEKLTENTKTLLTPVVTFTESLSTIWMTHITKWLSYTLLTKWHPKLLWFLGSKATSCFNSWFLLYFIFFKLMILVNEEKKKISRSSRHFFSFFFFFFFFFVVVASVPFKTPRFGSLVVFARNSSSVLELGSKKKKKRKEKKRKKEKKKKKERYIKVK